MKKQPVIFLFLILISSITFSQKTRLSFATDGSVLRSFKEGQKFWAVGQTVNFNFHFTPKDGPYAWFIYYSPGRFSNNLFADAKSSATVPQQVQFRNNGEMRLTQISIGWKHYLAGTYDSESKWNMYAYAGFGLMRGRIINTQSAAIDTSVYNTPVLNGKDIFRRLTLDLGLGVEFPIGGDFFLYLEGRTLIPTTDFPTPYLLVNQDAPFTATANLGLRILF